MKKELFDEMYSMNINPYIEKDYKGLSYLSWATAYKSAMDKDPAMTYEILEDSDGMMFFSRGDVHIVKTTVTMFGEIKKMILPIMDNKHNAVAKPNSRQVNDNIMRCLAKNIAMFGIGLPLYVGEDLENLEKQVITEFKNKEPEKKTQAEKYLESREGMIERLSEYVRGEKLERMLVYYKVKAIEGMTDEQLKNATNQVFNKKKEKKNGN